MTNNKIRVHSKTEYVIEVNDQGETISFDLEDTSLPSRLFKMYEAMESLTTEYMAKGKALDARPDEPRIHLAEAELGEDVPAEQRIITKNQYDGAQLLDSFYKEARKAMDGFLGEGACQKIFGNTNYQSMFEDLLEQLTPEFKKMGLNTESIKTRAAQKHGPKPNKYRGLK